MHERLCQAKIFYMPKWGKLGFVFNEQPFNLLSTIERYIWLEMVHYYAIDYGKEARVLSPMSQMVWYHPHYTQTLPKNLQIGGLVHEETLVRGRKERYQCQKQKFRNCNAPKCALSLWKPCNTKGTTTQRRTAMAPTSSVSAPNRPCVRALARMWQCLSTGTASTSDGEARTLNFKVISPNKYHGPSVIRMYLCSMLQFPA